MASRNAWHRTALRWSGVTLEIVAASFLIVFLHGGALVDVHSLLTTLNPIEGNLLLQLPADANGSQVDIVPSDRTDLVVFAPAHSRVLLSVNDIPFQSFEMPQAGVARVMFVPIRYGPNHITGLLLSEAGGDYEWKGLSDPWRARLAGHALAAVVAPDPDLDLGCGCSPGDPATDTDAGRCGERDTAGPRRHGRGSSGGLATGLLAVADRLRRPIPKRIALLASWLLLVPLLPELLQSATNALRGLVLQQGYSPYLLPQHLDSLVWLVLIVAGGSVLLRTLIIRTLDVGGPGRAVVAPSNRLPGWVAAVLILAALPIHAKLDQSVDLTVFEKFFTTSRISRLYSCPSPWRRSWRRSTLKAPSRSSRKRSTSAPFSLVSFSVAARPTSCWCRFPCCWAFFCLPAS